jgi:hypothetical protein
MLADEAFALLLLLRRRVQIKLSKERDSLAQTSKKQARDLQKVLSFDALLFFFAILAAAIGLRSDLCN